MQKQLTMWQEFRLYLHEEFSRNSRPELTPEQRYDRRGNLYFFLGLAVFLGSITAPVTLAAVGVPFAWVFLLLTVVVGVGWIRFLRWYERRGY